MKYKIKQITRDTRAGKDIPYMFMHYDFALEHGFDLNDYDVVYEGDIELENPEQRVHIENYLEHLFYIFNMEHPKDFKGHSLSVSDVVEIDGKNYYCDFAGWKEIKKEDLKLGFFESK